MTSKLQRYVSSEQEILEQWTMFDSDGNIKKLWRKMAFRFMTTYKFIGRKEVNAIDKLFGIK